MGARFELPGPIEVALEIAMTRRRIIRTGWWES
jgi:hypothetical protein